jgi:hypothetical protein
MTSVVKYYGVINSVAVIGNYLPRQCGIATFTTDLVEGLSAEAPDINCWAAVMNDKPEGYPYPDKVRFEINQKKSDKLVVMSRKASDFLKDIYGVPEEKIVFIYPGYAVYRFKLLQGQVRRGRQKGVAHRPNRKQALCAHRQQRMVCTRRFQSPIRPAARRGQRHGRSLCRGI